MANKKQLLISTLAGLLATAIFFSILYKKSLELFPNNDTFFELSSVSDGNFEDGNSTTSIDTSDKHLTFNYTLGDKSETPYAMIIFHTHKLFRSIDLRRYDYIHIKLHPEETSNFTITLYTYIPGFSQPDNSQTHRPYSIICYPKKGKTEYYFKLSDFATPNWWFSAMNVRAEDVPPNNWGQITHLSISDATQEKNKPLHMVIEKISFDDSIPPKLIVSLLLGFIVSLFIYFIPNYKKKKKNREIKKRIYSGNYKKIYSDEDVEKLFTYIHENFSNPLLTLEKIETYLKLNQFQISEIVSDKYNMKYKKYLNYIRVEEAKRLLATTDIPINKIAENVGYCYPNSFSRVFRQFEGITPMEYRKQNS